MESVFPCIIKGHSYVVSSYLKFTQANKDVVSTIPNLSADREIVHCKNCKDTCIVLPLMPSSFSIERALHILGQNQQEYIQPVFDQLHDIIKRVCDRTKWPKQWQELGYPRLSISNEGFVNRIGGLRGGGIDLLKAFGFKEEGEYLILNVEDINSLITLQTFDGPFNVLEQLEKESQLLKEQKRNLTNNFQDVLYSIAKKALVMKISPADGDFNRLSAARALVLDGLTRNMFSTALVNPVLEALSGFEQILGELAEKEKKKAQQRMLMNVFGLATQDLTTNNQHSLLNNNENENGNKNHGFGGNLAGLLSTENTQQSRLGAALLQEYQKLQQKKREQMREEKAAQRQKETITRPIRDKNTPAGLYNYMNSCSFNSLLQTYFMLPQLRQEVFSWEVVRSPAQDEEIQLNSFVTKLKQLYASMMLTEEQAVDPTSVIRALHNTSASQTIQIGRQEDVHEVNCQFLQSCEDFLVKLTNRANVIQQYFFGGVIEEFRIPVTSPEGTVSIQSEQRKDSICHIMLDINDHNNLYSSLEAYLSTTVDFERIKNVPKITYFEKLPQVLIFQLHRAQFNSMRGSAFKLNSKFKFNDTIYMDEYLYSNRQQFEETKEKTLQLEHQKEILSSKLDELCNYQNSGSSLVDFISGTLSFYQEHGDKMADPETRQKVQENLDSSLQRVREEIASVQSQLEQVEIDLENVRQVANGNREHVYHLHSVLMHNGISGFGHYWAFIKQYLPNSFSSYQWLKCNDTMIERVNESEVHRYAEGGADERTSAYCLFYVSADLAQNAPHIVPMVPSGLLP